MVRSRAQRGVSNHGQELRAILRDARLTLAPQDEVRSEWNSALPPRVAPRSASPFMNEHVKRPSQVERTEFGLRLTDVQPLAGIPAVWRLAAILSTLVMGFLAMIAALYFGRAVLLPVVAALVVGVTLSPITEFGARFNIPTPVSAVALIVALAAVIGVLITFFAGPVTDWIGRAPEIGAAVQQKLRVFDYPLSVLQHMKSSIKPAARGAPTVSVATSPAEVGGTLLL